jgi:Chaperone of endosialidase
MKTVTNILYAVFALVCVGFVRNAQAVNPPPDGGYPGFTTAEGTKALQSLTTGSANTAVGWLSLFSNAGGSFNTATGAGSLLFNTADDNTAFGAAALLFNTTGINNTAVGVAALLHNTIAQENTATGAFALFSNTEGSANTANGMQALISNTIGSANTADGFQALYFNTTGNNNTANGYAALAFNTTGDSNTANGFEALFSNTTGIVNTANGAIALYSNTTGGFNTAYGVNALAFNTTGNNNIALGYAAGFDVTTADNVICIGANVAGANVSNSCYINNIFNATSSEGTAVLINSDGRLGTTTSSRRFKEEIKPMSKASEAILALKPVTFRYKKEIDPAGTTEFGLVAEEVEKVNPDLVVRDKEGKPYSVRYDQVNAMLLNEFLKEHRKNEEQEATISRQQKQIDALTEGLQKVSAQLEASKPAPRTVVSDQ